MNALDLFSGIGGFAKGFERAGLQTVAFCEADPFARIVLARHWPATPCYDDVRTLDPARLRADGLPRIDVICGGFPCQDISAAGLGRGLGGPRSGLWCHMLRLVQGCRPDWVVVENVPALRVRGADSILASLDAAGYACWPLLVGAVHAGAPHRRQRVFIVAHARGTGLEGRLRRATLPQAVVPAERCRWWQAEPGVGRVADGVPQRVDRLRALGNAAVPAVAEMIGRAIMSADAAATSVGGDNASEKSASRIGPERSKKDHPPKWTSAPSSHPGCCLVSSRLSLP